MSNKAEYFRENITLAACPVTGISITLGIPKIPHKVFEYQNPLAIIDNAKDIAALPRISQLSLSPEVLAGAFLCILSNLSLIDDKLSATQRNILLQDVHKHYLCEALHLFSRVTRKQSETLPHVSFAVQEDKYSKILELVKNYTKTCNEILFPKMETQAPVYSIFTIGKTVELESYLTPEVRKNFKLLAKTMLENEEIKEKTYRFLATIGEGKNLININGEMRAKLIEKLEVINSISSMAMIQIIRNIQKNMNNEEILFVQKNETYESEISSSVPIMAKKSLKEILMEKANGRSKSAGDESNSLIDINKGGTAQSDSLSIDNSNNNEDSSHDC